jgi:hypothetical protein
MPLGKPVPLNPSDDRLRGVVVVMLAATSVEARGGGLFAGTDPWRETHERRT